MIPYLKERKDFTVCFLRTEQKKLKQTIYYKKERHKPFPHPTPVETKGLCLWIVIDL